MQLIPLPHYFIVKINKEEQKKRKEKIGSLYVHASHTFMQRNMQCGEIVGIGSVAHKNFAEPEIGQTLIFHHFIEGENSKKSNFIYSDETYNYYNVTASQFNGHRCEAYGVWNGSEIIPHPDFVFIEPEVKTKEISATEFIEQNTTQVGSLILFTNWEESRESKEERAGRITTEIKEASKGKNLSDSTKMGLLEKQNEAEKITESLNKQQYSKYKVAYINPKYKSNGSVYALSVAAQTPIEFMNKEYLIVNYKYCVATSE